MEERAGDALADLLLGSVLDRLVGAVRIRRAGKSSSVFCENRES